MKKDMHTGNPSPNTETHISYMFILNENIWVHLEMQHEVFESFVQKQSASISTC